MTLSPEGQKRYARDCQRAVDALVKANGNVSQAARDLKWAKTSFAQRLAAAEQLGLRPTAAVAQGEEGKKAKPFKPTFVGRVDVFQMSAERLPPKGKIKRFLLTAAQNNTPVNEVVWNGLLAFAKHVGARLMVSRFTYKKSAYAFYGGREEKNGGPASRYSRLTYDPAIEPYVCDERVELAPGLMWCGEINIIPTAERPLSGFESYTGRASGIFPHTKIAMDSVATTKGHGAKFNYTTGCCTQRNYIQCKAGQKAEFHHAYGALLVEVDHEGNWFCRQINADKTGTFYDLDVRVQNGKVTTGHRVEAITWGDVHVAQIDPMARDLAWAKGGMLDTLRPRFQFFHDVLDFRARSHHDLKDPHKMFARHVRGQESVSAEVGDVAAFFRAAHRPWVQSIAVESNHHEHLLRWLKETDWRRDPVNAEFYIEAQAEVLKAIRRGDDAAFNVLEWAVNRSGGAPGVKFLGLDESFITCKDFGGGIENGMHGHCGPNGAAGSLAAFAKMGRKANVGHAHSAGIHDGVYRAGTSSLFDLGYNAGPSSWSHSEIVTYPNAKRAIVTLWNNKWRA